MKISVQTDDFNMLKEATKSDCDKVRFGPEFCEWKIPNLDLLKEAYEFVAGEGKEFTYVTPLVSNNSLEKIREHLAFLNDRGKIEVTINDFGVFDILGHYPNIRPHIGRQLVFIPARCPWPQITETSVDFFARRHAAKIYYQTSLNYIATISFYRKHGFEGVDFDWIPQCFSSYYFLVKNGLNLSIHLHLVPVTLTRRCHMARFLGEDKPEKCSRPCNSRAFLLKHDIIDVVLFLNGNVVFRLTNPSKRTTKSLDKIGVSELIISVNPITKIESRNEINALIRDLNP